MALFLAWLAIITNVVLLSIFLLVDKRITNRPGKTWAWRVMPWWAINIAGIIGLLIGVSPCGS